MPSDRQWSDLADLLELPGIDHLYRDPPRGFDCDSGVWPLLSMGFWGFHIEFVEVHA